MMLDTSELMKRTKAALPTAGVNNGAHAFATNGRKSGEGAGDGTGVPVWASVTSGTTTWIDYRTGVEVLV